MELHELKSLYKAVFMEFGDKSPVGAGRRCMFIVSFDRRSFGLYDTLGRFWSVPKHQVENVTGLDASDVLHFDGDQIYTLDDGARRVIGEQVDRVRSPVDNEVVVDISRAFSEDFWSGGDIWQ